MARLPDNARRRTDHLHLRGWMKRLPNAPILDESLLHSQHDRKSPVWRWLMQTMAKRAIRSQHIESLHVLVAREAAQLDVTALWRSAAGYLDLPAMQALAGGPWSLPVDMPLAPSGETAVLLAAKDGHHVLMAWLHEQGAAHDQVNAQGMTPWELFETTRVFALLPEDEQDNLRRAAQAGILAACAPAATDHIRVRARL